MKGRGSSGLQVHLSSSESQEWHTDPDMRRRASAAFQTRAAARGRRYFEVFDNSGKFLHLGEVGPAAPAVAR